MPRRRRRLRRKRSHETARRKLGERLSTPQSLPLLGPHEPLIVSRAVLSESLPAPESDDEPLPRLVLSPGASPSRHSGKFAERSAERWESRATRLPEIADQHAKAVAALVAAEMKLAGMVRRQQRQLEAQSATAIQCQARQLLARADVRRRRAAAEARRRDAAATKLQAVLARGVQARARRPQFEARALGWRRERAARSIQAGARGRGGRRRAAAARRARADGAAARIQGLARGFLLRRYRRRAAAAVRVFVREQLADAVWGAQRVPLRPGAATAIGMWFRRCLVARGGRAARRALLARVPGLAAAAAARARATAARDTLVVRVRAARRLPLGDLTSTDPFVEVLLSNAVSVRTRTLRRARHPVWDETFSLPATRADLQTARIVFEVRDDDLEERPVVALLRLSLASLLRCPRVDGWRRLRAPVGAKKLRDAELWVLLSHEVCSPAGEELAPAPAPTPVPGRYDRRAGPRLADLPDGAPPEVPPDPRLLSVVVRQCTVRNATRARVCVGERSATTETRASARTLWRRELHFAVKDPAAALEVWVGPGKASVPLAKLPPGEPVERWLPINGGEHRVLVAMQWRAARGLQMEPVSLLNLPGDPPPAAGYKWLRGSTVEGVRLCFAPKDGAVLVEEEPPRGVAVGVLGSAHGLRAVQAMTALLRDDAEARERVERARTLAASQAALAEVGSWVRCFDPQTRGPYFRARAPPHSVSWFAPSVWIEPQFDPPTAAALPIQRLARSYLARHAVADRRARLRAAQRDRGRKAMVATEELLDRALLPEKEPEEDIPEVVACLAALLDAVVARDRAEREAEDNWFRSLFTPRTLADSAVAIQRVWRGHRDRRLVHDLLHDAHKTEGAVTALPGTAGGGPGWYRLRNKALWLQVDVEARVWRHMGALPLSAWRQLMRDARRLQRGEVIAVLGTVQGGDGLYVNRGGKLVGRQLTPAGELRHVPVLRVAQRHRAAMRIAALIRGMLVRRRGDPLHCPRKRAAARVIQRVARAWLARARRFDRRVATAKAKGRLAAMPGQIDGLSGWYTDGKAAVYVRRRGDEWTRVLAIGLEAHRALKLQLAAAEEGQLLPLPPGSPLTKDLFVRARDGALVALRRDGERLVELPLKRVVERTRRLQLRAAVRLQAVARGWLARRAVAAMLARLEQERQRAAPLEGTLAGETGWYKVGARAEYHCSSGSRWEVVASVPRSAWDSLEAEARQLRGGAQLIALPGTEVGGEGLYMRRSTKLVGLLRSQGGWRRGDPRLVGRRLRAAVRVQALARGWLARLASGRVGRRARQLRSRESRPRSPLALSAERARASSSSSSQSPWAAGSIAVGPTVPRGRSATTIQRGPGSPRLAPLPAEPAGPAVPRGRSATTIQGGPGSPRLAPLPPAKKDPFDGRPPSREEHEAATRVQAVLRMHRERERVHERRAEAAQAAGVMVVVKGSGTIQGRSGWYATPQGLIYNVKVSPSAGGGVQHRTLFGPITRETYDALRARASAAGAVAVACPGTTPGGSGCYMDRQGHVSEWVVNSATGQWIAADV